MTIFIFFGRIKMDWWHVGIRFSYQIKRKREGKRGGKKEKENFTLFFYTRNYVLNYSIH
jgi:hypothetical protein